VTAVSEVRKTEPRILGSAEASMLCACHAISCVLWEVLERWFDRDSRIDFEVSGQVLVDAFRIGRSREPFEVRVPNPVPNLVASGA
jgi:hypothetical protein